MLRIKKPLLCFQYSPKLFHKVEEDIVCHVFLSHDVLCGGKLIIVWRIDWSVF